MGGPVSYTGPGVTETKPVVVEQATRFEFQSRVNHRRYAISVATPVGTYPEMGCPVLYVLDGEWYFASAVEAVRINAPGVVVVGIGYPEAEAYVAEVLDRHRPLPGWAKELSGFRAAVGFERMFDLSLPVSDEVLARDFLPGWWKIRAEDVGGLDAFLRMLEGEIKPRVGKLVRIDSSNQAIFGHSLGGLAVLHALFTEPNAFCSYIAASPAIWWSEKAVLEGERKFGDMLSAGLTAPRVLITMGSEEETADPRIAGRFTVGFQEYAALVRKHRMVENARELTERLRALYAPGECKVEEFVVFPKQDHGLSPWPALGRAVSFAFPP